MGLATKRVLVVDDEEGLRSLISQVLRDDGHDVVTAESGEAALELFAREAFPIVLTDIFMKEMTGLDLLAKIRAQNQTTQVVIMTSNASLESATAALRSGAYDFLMKPFEDLDAISSVIHRAAEKVEQIRQKEQKASELKQLNAELEHLAHKDDLTGLSNRRFFLEELEGELADCEERRRTFSLLFIDVDHFKHYNDSFGHLAGDDLLGKLAELIRQNTPRTVTAARYGGEEFIVLAKDTPRGDARILAERLRMAVEEHRFHGRESQPSGRVTLSIGVSTYPDDGADCKTLILRADEAMYKAKQSGRNRVFDC